MASRTQKGSRPGRRIMWLGAAVAIAVVAYTAAWFSMARALEQRVAATLSELNGGGMRAFCEEPAARGFPFRIGIFCKGVFYESVHDGVSVRAGALRSTANVYEPFRVLGELDGPAVVSLPFTVPLQLRWESLRASARLAQPLPQRISLEGKAVILSTAEHDAAQLATLQDVQRHARQRDADLEVAVSFRNVGLTDEVGPDLPPLEGRAMVLIDDGVSMVESRPRDLRGQSGRIEEMVIGVAGEAAGFSLSGPVSVGEDGLVDADLAVKIDDPAGLAQLLVKIFPEAREEIMAVSSLASGLDGAPVKLRVTRGNVFAGIFPVGRIPPL